MGVLAAIAVAGALVTGRVPGTTETAIGPRLGSRKTHLSTEAGIARAEIEDVIVNDAPQELEARYELRVPPGAVITRAALDVDGTLVEGNVVEAGRARAIYRSIVDETRRDPLLVERRQDGTVSIRVFPLPSHGSRRIVLTYDEPAPLVGEPSVAAATIGEEAFVVRASLDAGAPSTRAIAIDVSRGQTGEAIAAAVAVARRTLDALEEGSRFVVLACDSACESMPSAGLLTASALTVAATKAWMRDLRPRGARDLAGAIAESASRVPAGGQVIWLGGGTPTAGELDRSRVALRVREAIGGSRELRLVGAGDDSPRLAAAAPELRATYDDLDLGDGRVASEERAAARLVSYALQAARLETQAGLEAWAGPGPDRIAAGDPITLVGTRPRDGAVPGSVVVRATVAGRPITRTLPVEPIGTTARADLLLAGARVDALERAGDAASLARAGRIAQEHKVLARGASWLALESEAMMQAFDVARSGRGGSVPVGGHRTKPVMMRTALSIMVVGRLPPETIQHTVRTHAPSFRFCYEAGLRAHPGLAGRVTLKFVIRRTGEVSLAEDAGSDVPDPETIACFVRTARTLVFPPTALGTITVLYPFVLTPLDDDARGAGGANGATRPLLQLRVPATGLPDPHEMWLLRYRVADAPGDPNAHEALVTALSKLGHTDEALAALEAFARAAPGEPRAWELLLSHPAQTSPTRAAEAASALADLFPRCAAAHARAAAAWTIASDPRRAAAHRRTAASLPPSSAPLCARPR